MAWVGRPTVHVGAGGAVLVKLLGRPDRVMLGAETPDIAVVVTATGDGSIAAALGANSTATAGPGGAIMLAHWDTASYPYKLTAVGAFMVGQDGVEPGKVYRLTADGKPIEVTL